MAFARVPWLCVGWSRRAGGCGEGAMILRVLLGWIVLEDAMLGVSWFWRPRVVRRRRLPTNPVLLRTVSTIYKKLIIKVNLFCELFQGNNRYPTSAVP